MNTPSRLLALITIVLPTAIGVGADEPAFNKNEMKFKAAYHRWVAYLYDHPDRLESPFSSSYTDVPPFEDIVKLGKPVVPFIAAEMMKDGVDLDSIPGSDFKSLLGEAILTIQGWKQEDFGDTRGFKDLNGRIFEKLRAEKIIPPARRSEPQK